MTFAGNAMNVRERIPILLCFFCWMHPKPRPLKPPAAFQILTNEYFTLA